MNQQAISPTSSRPREGIVGALRSSTFVVLWLSEAVSLVGDRILMVTMIALIYERTHSAIGVGLLSMLKALPALFLGMLAGVFVDRWSHKWTMVISNVLQGLLVLLIPTTDALAMLFALYLGLSIISQFFVPARSATIPDLVPTHSLTAANSLFAMSFVGAIAIGPAVGGWITDQFGLNAAFYVDALTFFVPALAVSFLAIPGNHQADIFQKTRNLKREWRDGLALVREHADIRLAFVLLGTAALQIASLSVLGILLAKENLGADVSAFGAMMSFMGMGMLVGAITNRLGSDLSHLRRASIGLVITGGGMALLPCLSSMPLMLPCCLLIGLGFVTVQIHAQTILQSTPQGLRGRALGMGQAVTGSVTFLAAALIGVLAERIGVPFVAFTIGLAALGVGAIMLRFRLKGA